MTSPLEALIKMQLAYGEGWAKLMINSFEAYSRLVEHNAKIFEHPTYARLHNIIPMGASWLDHYGKRSTDVDPEKV